MQQWVVDAYLLTLGALILVGGSFGDLFGAHRIFLIGMCRGLAGKELYQNGGRDLATLAAPLADLFLDGAAVRPATTATAASKSTKATKASP